MLTRLIVSRFKRIKEADVELGGHIVFVGPNNSGKTSALQALSLWYFGLSQWIAEKSDGASGKKRYGVTINRKDLFALPVPHTNLLWHDLHVRSGTRNSEGKTTSQNILFSITCEGVTNDRQWSIGLEFDYSNSESLFCRPLTQPLTDELVEMMREVVKSTRVAFLPPMSGLATEEALLPSGRIDVLVGQGRTAEVLRNLCHSVAEKRPKDWKTVVEHIDRLFGVRLNTPQFDASRGELNVSFKTKTKATLDLSSAGRGLQQTLLLLTYLYTYRASTILLDEPDAHLEVLRQRQTYELLTSIADQTQSQIVAATHSEQVLNLAAGKDTVIAFLGSPHRINDQGTQLKKALLQIGYEHYVQAETKGWVLYVEGSTDKAILETLAGRLKHRCHAHLSGAYVDYVDCNHPPDAKNRFYGLREAVPNLRGIALFDRLDRTPFDSGDLKIICWRKKEIENYICTERTLMAWAAGEIPDASSTLDLVDQAEAPRRTEAMRKAIDEMTEALSKLGRPSPWGSDLKISDEFLDPLFRRYHQILELPDALMRKKKYYELAKFIDLSEVDAEIIEKLDAIADVADCFKATPT